MDSDHSFGQIFDEGAVKGSKGQGLKGSRGQGLKWFHVFSIDYSGDICDGDSNFWGQNIK